MRVKFMMVTFMLLTLFCKSEHQIKVEECVKSAQHEDAQLCELKMQCLQYLSDEKLCIDKVKTVYISGIATDIKEAGIELTKLIADRDSEITKYSAMFAKHKGRICEYDADDEYTYCDDMDSVNTYTVKYDSLIKELKAEIQVMTLKKEKCESKESCKLF